MAAVATDFVKLLTDTQFLDDAHLEELHNFCLVSIPTGLPWRPSWCGVVGSRRCNCTI